MMKNISNNEIIGTVRISILLIIISDLQMILKYLKLNIFHKF